MEELLVNPVYHALISNDAKLGLGTGKVKFFDEQVSPFVGFQQEYDKGFDDLFHLLPPGRRILYATPELLHKPEGWDLLAEVRGLQFVLEERVDQDMQHSIQPVLLHSKNAEEMVQLAKLTKPGPFGMRTIEFGHYYGIFEGSKLVAMTGQRLHVSNYTEISAVCTHPHHLSKGYAAALMQHQIQLIRNSGQIPFLHVREDNERAISLYERLGFSVRGPMNFYFLKRKEVNKL